MDTLHNIASHYEASATSLTNTWKALSYVIAEHIRPGTSSTNEQQQAFKALNDYLIQEYQVKFRNQQHAAGQTPYTGLVSIHQALQPQQPTAFDKT